MNREARITGKELKQLKERPSLVFEEGRRILPF